MLLATVSRAEEEKRQVKKTNKSILLKASNDKKKSRGRISTLGFYLWNTKFKQSSPFRIHRAIKIVFQVIICKETDSIQIFPCSEFVVRDVSHVFLIHGSVLPCQNRERSVKNRMKLISGMQEIVQWRGE